jgi:mannose-1-phosphate guanylyltransferase
MGVPIQKGKANHFLDPAKGAPMFAVIMAGGRGTRFWPRSRKRRPKQLLTILGEKTILEQTVDRILPLCGWERLLVVTEVEQAPLIRKILPKLPDDQLLIEPLGKNTAPCIGLAALFLAEGDPEAAMVVLPADHHIADVRDFQDTLCAAVQAAQEGERLITLGIPPTFPETGYGYIEKGDPATEVGPRRVWAVKAFHEKPDRKKAESMLSSGRFYWNSGMFIWTAAAILNQLDRFTPALYQELLELKKRRHRPGWKKALKEAYERMEDISIDYAVMEKADNVLMLEGNFGWNDVGTWEAVYQLKEKDEAGNSTQGPVIALDSRGCLVYSPRKLVALLGVENLVVVETADALLVCPRERSQEVKKIVERLEAEGQKKLL